MVIEFLIAFSSGWIHVVTIGNGFLWVKKTHALFAATICEYHIDMKLSFCFLKQVFSLLTYFNNDLLKFRFIWFSIYLQVFPWIIVFLVIRQETATHRYPQTDIQRFNPNPRIKPTSTPTPFRMRLTYWMQVQSKQSNGFNISTQIMMHGYRCMPANTA